MVFDKGVAQIEKNGKVLAIAKRTNFNLYELKVRHVDVGTNACVNEENLDLWHKRLGHLSYESIKQLEVQVDGIKNNMKMSLAEKCQICIEAKQTQQPHKQQRKRAKRPLELIRSDLFGPVNPASHDGMRYVLTFIDDFTHFTVSYTIKSKSEVLYFFKIYEAMKTAHFNTRISRFRCDNGREYMSAEMREFFYEKGVQFKFTIRYTPQQNGGAERMNRNIIEKALSMILGCKLDKNFWSEAVMTAVYLINRRPTTALEKRIPAALWYDRKPNISKLKVFGCIAFLKIPKEIVGGKFESRSKRCYFIGYCVNGYKLWCPEEKKFFFGHDVIFLENKFDHKSFDNNFWDQNKECETTLDEENTNQEVQEDIEDNIDYIIY